MLGHILHYALMQKYVLVHIHWGMLSIYVNDKYIIFHHGIAIVLIIVYSSAAHWFKDMKEVANSVLSPGCMDLPIDAGMWLKHFKSQNSKLLSELDVCMS